MDELLLDLAELHGVHAAAVGGEVAGGFGFEAQEDLFGDVGGEDGEEFLFECCQVALEIFKIQVWVRIRTGLRASERVCLVTKAERQDGQGGGPAFEGCAVLGLMGDRCCVEGLCGGFEVICDALGFESGVGLSGGFRGHADGGVLLLLGGFHNGLGAPGEAVDLAQAAGALLLTGVVFVEGFVDAAQDDFKRDSGFAPGFDECPVEGGEQEQGAAPALEMLFDFGEVVEIVLHGGLSGSACEGG